MAQQAAPARSAKKQAEMIAEFVSAYDLAKAPPELVERVRVAFVDTIGVMIGGAFFGESMFHTMRDASKPRSAPCRQSHSSDRSTCNVISRSGTAGSRP